DKNGTTIVDLGAYEYYNNPDLDGDGLLDSWERQIIDADPNDGIRTYADVDPNADFDNDGLANKDEYARATSPLNPDCDGDTLSDGAEVHTHSTNPLAADSDADKFGDAIELAHGMNPNASDTSLFNHVATVIGSSAVEMSAAGLYTEAAIRNLYVGTPLLAVDLAAAEVAIDLQVECSDSLTSGSWQPFDFSSPDWSRTATGWLHHAPGSHCFYRIFLGERPARDDRTIR
ncbi:MAG: MSCRAMM family adhesin SdrC, partial [Akkermansiaceae bacterium]|nr:MSCRAMM family adhesin SdrC [Akkermansiaceae bacterium]